MFGEVRARIEAAADAAVAAAKEEFDPLKLSLKGGPSGLHDSPDHIGHNSSERGQHLGRRVTAR